MPRVWRMLLQVIRFLLPSFCSDTFSFKCTCVFRWDQILDELRRKTEDQVRRANQVKITGATGAYSAAFEAMEKQLVDIKRILDSATISNDDLVYVQSRINETDFKLDETETKLKSLDSEVAGIKSSIMQASHLF